MRKVTGSLLAIVGVAATAALAFAGNGGHEGDVPNGGANSSQEPIYRSYGECNDCWSSGITLRGMGQPAGGNISVPAHVANNRVYAQIFWVTLGTAPIPGAVTVNGNPVVPIPIGPVTPSPCWGPSFAYAWRADVLPFVVAGPNALAGFIDFGAVGTYPETFGVSMVVIHRTNTVDKEIVVLAGNDPVGAVLGQADLPIPVISAAGFGAELTMIVADGQTIFDDEVLWNATVVSSPNAFQGFDPGPGAGYWDTQEFGVATGGSNTATLRTLGDCLNWVGTVLCVKRGGCVVPVTPSTWSHIKGLMQN